MQGKSDPNAELLEAAVLRRQLVPHGSVEAFLADHRRELFPSGRGRPSIPGDVVASVMVLQALEGLSDRALRDRTSWKVATGLPIDSVGFAPVDRFDAAAFNPEQPRLDHRHLTAPRTEHPRQTEAHQMTARTLTSRHAHPTLVELASSSTVS